MKLFLSTIMILVLLIIFVKTKSQTTTQMVFNMAGGSYNNAALHRDVTAAVTIVYIKN